MTFDPHAPQVPKKPSPLGVLGGLFLFVISVSQMYSGYRKLFPREPQVGDRCDAGSAACVDSANALFCRNGRMQAKVCDGVGGCQTTGGTVNCRFTMAEPGEECISGGSSCSSDHRQMLSCVGGRMAVLGACPGPRACASVVGDAGVPVVLCDGLRSAPGTPCAGETFGCSSDGQAALRCQNGSMQPVSFCRGPGGCSVDPAFQVQCDRSVMVLGEVCVGSGAACDAAGANLLQCRDGVVALHTACAPPASCVTQNGRVNCIAPATETPEAPVRRGRHR